jgi:translation initiation factor 1
MCPGCAKPIDRCACREPAEVIPRTDGIVCVSRETKGRKGKGVTLVTGVPLTPSDLKQLAKELKQRCGTGGAVKDGTIEIQGDQRDVLMQELAARGWTVKRAGG